MVIPRIVKEGKELLFLLCAILGRLISQMLSFEVIYLWNGHVWKVSLFPSSSIQEIIMSSNSA